MWHIKTCHAELKLGLGRAYPRKAAPREQVLAVSLGRSRHIRFAVSNAARPIWRLIARAQHLIGPVGADDFERTILVAAGRLPFGRCDIGSPFEFFSDR
jgi:hypothetical protein